VSAFVAALGHVMTVVGLGYAVYSVLINTSFLLLSGLALSDLLAYRRRLDFAGYDEWFREPHPRGVSVLMPAYN